MSAPTVALMNMPNSSKITCSSSGSIVSSIMVTCRGQVWSIPNSQKVDILQSLAACMVCIQKYALTLQLHTPVTNAQARSPACSAGCHHWHGTQSSSSETLHSHSACHLMVQLKLVRVDVRHVLQTKSTQHESLWNQQAQNCNTSCSWRLHKLSLFSSISCHCHADSKRTMNICLV